MCFPLLVRGVRCVFFFQQTTRTTKLWHAPNGFTSCPPPSSRAQQVNNILGRVFAFNVTFNFDNKRLCVDFGNRKKSKIARELATETKKNSIYPQGNLFMPFILHRPKKNETKRSTKSIPCARRVYSRMPYGSVASLSHIIWGEVMVRWMKWLTWV